MDTYPEYVKLHPFTPEELDVILGRTAMEKRFSRVQYVLQIQALLREGHLTALKDGTHDRIGYYDQEGKFLMSPPYLDLLALMKLYHDIYLSKDVTFSLVPAHLHEVAADSLPLNTDQKLAERFEGWKFLATVHISPTEAKTYNLLTRTPVAAIASTVKNSTAEAAVIPYPPQGSGVFTTSSIDKDSPTGTGGSSPCPPPL